MTEFVKKYREWKKKHPLFPLTVHPCGQWSKKVRGRVFYFGPLSAPDAALSLWLEEKDYLLAGQEPPTYHNGMTVEELCDKHLADIDSRIASGKYSQNSKKEYVTARQVLDEAGLGHLVVELLTPENFAIVSKVLEKSGRRIRTQKNIITSIRAIFNWGYEMEYWDRRVRFGPRFRAPSLQDIEAEQEIAGVNRFLDRKLILAAIKEANPRLKIAILLGINCAFYPSDTKAITWEHLHFDSVIPYHDFRRVKTKRKRMAALWPETVAAITDYRNNFRSINKYPEVLLTCENEPFAKGGSTWLAESFNALAEKVGERPNGVSLGSLRHTYGTLMDLVSDTQMIDLTMGHVAGTVRGQATKSLQRRIYSQFNINELKRLKAVADVVHDWLYKGKIP